MFDLLTIDTVRLFREFTTTKLAEILATVNAQAAAVITAIGGTGIKSVQRGVVSITANATSTTVTVSAVNMGKAQLRMLGAKNTEAVFMPMIELSSSTTITVSRQGGAAGSSTTVSWELTEWK